MRASDCNSLPLLQAHPTLLRPRRSYLPEWEGALFDLQRVYDFLATFTFECKVNRNGQVTLKGLQYTVGLAHMVWIGYVGCGVFFCCPGGTNGVSAGGGGGGGSVGGGGGGGGFVGWDAGVRIGSPGIAGCDFLVGVLVGCSREVGAETEI